MAEGGRAVKHRISFHFMPVSPGLGWDPETSAIELHLVGTQHAAPAELSGPLVLTRSGTIILFSVRALGLRAHRANLPQ